MSFCINPACDFSSPASDGNYCPACQTPRLLHQRYWVIEPGGTGEQTEQIYRVQDRHTGLIRLMQVQEVSQTPDLPAEGASSFYLQLPTDAWVQCQIASSPAPAQAQPSFPRQLLGSLPLLQPDAARPRRIAAAIAVGIMVFGVPLPRISNPWQPQVPARLAANQLVTAPTSPPVAASPAVANIGNGKELLDEVWQIIDRNYVDGSFNHLNWQAVRTQYLSRVYPDREAVYKAIQEMVGKLGDPYTRFMSPQEYKSLEADTAGKLIGVGLQLAEDQATKYPMVVSPIENSPAAAAGILAKDIIRKINDQSTTGMDLNRVVNLIRGAAGTEVKLTLQRGQQELEFRLKRAEIQLHPVRFVVQQSPVGKVAYLRLSQFSAKAPQEMRTSLRDLERQGVKGYILDLRANPGGLLYASIEIARMWIREGTIVDTINRQGQVEREKADRTSITDKPLVVLVDGGSASASEILAGALQDNHRAILVGNKTFGKGLVQAVRDLADDCGLKVTVARYHTPSGRDINKTGILPNVVVNLTEAQQQSLSRDRSKVATAADPQYAKALALLSQRISSKH